MRDERMDWRLSVRVQLTKGRRVNNTGIACHITCKCGSVCLCVYEYVYAVCAGCVEVYYKGGLANAMVLQMYPVGTKLLVL